MLCSLDEARRLNILRRYAILDTPPEEVFDRVARLASRHFRTPIGTVTFIDEARQWFKAAQGMDLRETGRDVAFCNVTIMGDEPLMVNDASIDPRFARNPLVLGKPHIRFYAGAPLLTADGFCMGTVSVIDMVPHPHARSEDCDMLVDLAALVVHELEMRLAASDVKSEIEARRRSEEEAHAAQERLRLAITHAPVVLAAVDSDLRYTWVYNPPLPLTPDYFLGKQDREIWPPEVGEKHTAFKRRVLETGQSGRTDLTLMIDGRPRHFEVAGEPLIKDGKVIGVSCAAMDVSERREMINNLRAAKDAAEAANRAKSKFLAAASHDLRQPVQAMVLYNATLQGRLKGHAAASVAARMKTSLDALQTLLEGLLDISRLDAGVVEPAVQAMPIQPLMQRLVEEYAVHARGKGLRLRLLCSSAWVRSDPALLERVLRNLLQNAIRYTERGGVIVGCRRQGDNVLLQVVDTGIGIAAANQEAIFDEFYQVGNEGRDRAKGLGLGLSIVRRLAALMGHRLDMNSQLGRGTTFSIQLSRAPASPTQAAGEQAELRCLEDRRVLVIDDEAIIRQGLEVLLTDWGCRVATAGDESEAVAAANAQAPDAIIADYRLQGGRTGTQAVRAVHRACGHAVPAIILTGDTAPERIAEVTNSGLAIAHKPLVPEKLQRMLCRQLGGACGS